MNIIVFIDRNFNLQSPEIFVQYYTLVEKMREIVDNNVVVLDDSSQCLLEFCDRSQKIIYNEDFEESVLPDFLAPIEFSEEKEVSNLDELYKEIRLKREKSVFIFGYDLLFDLLPYADKVYQFSCNEQMIIGDKFYNLFNERGWKMEKTGEPFFESKHIFNLVEYKNLKRKKYDFATKELDLSYD